MAEDILDYLLCTFELMISFLVIYCPQRKPVSTIKRTMMAGVYIGFALLSFILPAYFAGICATFSVYIIGRVFIEKTRDEFLSDYLMTYFSLNIFSTVYVFLLVEFGFQRGIETDIVCAIILLIQFACIWFFRKHLPQGAYSLKPGVRAPILLVMCFLMLMEAVFTYLAGECDNSSMTYLSTLFLVVGELMILFVMYRLLYYINVRQSLESKMEYLETLADAQSNSIEKILRREVDTRRFRHDIRADIGNLYRMAQSNDVGGIRSYLEQMDSTIKNLQMGKYHVMNETADLMLSMCLRGNERWSSVKGKVGPLLKMSERDLGIVLYNLLNNAVEAIQRLEESKRRIQVTFARGQTYLEIRIVNTYEENAIIETSTTKMEKANHGFGRINVEDAVRRNGGEIKVEKDGARYTVLVRVEL